VIVGLVPVIVGLFPGASARILIESVMVLPQWAQTIKTVQQLNIGPFIHLPTSLKKLQKCKKNFYIFYICIHTKVVNLNNIFLFFFAQVQSIFLRNAITQPSQFRRLLRRHIFYSNQGCQIFLGPNIPKREKYTKRPQTIQNIYKLYQMTEKCFQWS
jgi:hypothetical protein